MMTSFEWFAIGLPLVGVAAALLYAGALNRSADRLNANVPATPTEADKKTPQRSRYNLNSELRLETAVKRANQAASSAEAATAKIKQASQERRIYRVPDLIRDANASFGIAAGASATIAGSYTLFTSGSENPQAK